MAMSVCTKIPITPLNKPLKSTMVCLTIPETLWFTNIFPSNRVLKWSPSPTLRQIHIATSKKIEKHTITSVGFYFFPFFPYFRSGDCCIAWTKYASFGCSNQNLDEQMPPGDFHAWFHHLCFITDSQFEKWLPHPFLSYGLYHHEWIVIRCYNPYLSMTKNPYLSMVLWLSWISYGGLSSLINPLDILI